MTYLYQCSDGYYRNRCKTHMDAARGQRWGISPHYPQDKVQRSKARCVECDREGVDHAGEN